METDTVSAVLSLDSAPHDLEEKIGSEGSHSPPEQQHDHKEASSTDNVPHHLEEKIAVEVSQSPEQLALEVSQSPEQQDAKKDSSGDIASEGSRSPPDQHDSRPPSPPENQHANIKEVSGDASESDSASDSDSDSSDEEDSNGISEYERQRLLRIQKNEERLRQLGLLDESKKPKRSAASKKKTPRKNPNPQNSEEHPARRQPKREVKGKISEELAWLAGLTNSRPKKSKPEKKKLRCGTCEGCTREEDCNTCIYCVERITGRINPRRCIFKQCRSKDGTNKKEGEDAQQNDPPSPTKEEREHSDECDVCANGGDLILCDTCPRGFHSNCHVPKIKKIPSEDEVWLCMECNPRTLPQGILIALLPNTTKLIKVKVIEPDPECLVCHLRCRYQDDLHCKACDNHFHSLCQQLDSKPKGGAIRVWKCNACKESNAPLLEQYTATARTPKKKNLKLFEGEHDDDCYICFNGGPLVCCDFCPKVFHLNCHIPALPAIPTGIWKCCECYASERNRMTRCGDCKACRAEDCGKCKFCLDRPKFGGLNKLKKTCIHRECPYQSFAETFVAGRIPGEITHGPSTGKKKKRRRESDASNLQGKEKKAKLERRESDASNLQGKEKKAKMERRESDASFLQGQEKQAKLERRESDASNLQGQEKQAKLE